MFRRISFSILLFFTLSNAEAFTQSNAELLTQGLKYRAEHKNREGFDTFCKLMKTDSSKIIYITNGSYFYCKYGFITTGSDKDKMKYYHIAEYLAQKAIKMDEKNAEAHYVYCLALARINEDASISDKIKVAKLVKKECDRCIELNPKHAGAYHVLGRWNSTIAGFNGVEKGMINAFYGGVPLGASYDNAIKCFQNAIINEPNYILHQYEMAVTLHDVHKDDYAIKFLQAADKLPATDEDNIAAKKKVEELLKKLKG